MRDFTAEDKLLLEALFEKYHKQPFLFPGFLFLVTGQSGAGKTYVCEILVELMKMFSRDKDCKEKLGNQDLFYSSNGDGFRKFCDEAEEESRVRQVIAARKKIYKKQYDIMPFMLLYPKIQKKFATEDFVVVNGSPRSEGEFKSWRSMINTPDEPGFFSQLVVVNLEISDQTTARWLLRRNREDTNTIKKIKKKLASHKEMRSFLKSVDRRQTRYVPRNLVGKVHFVTIDAEKDRRETTLEFFEKLHDFSE